VKRGKGNRATIKAALDALGPAPAPPLEPLMTCPEPTFEGLRKLFAVGQPSLGIFAAEGGQFVGGHGMTDDAKLRTAAGLSKLWDDGETRRVHMLPLKVHLPTALSKTSCNFESGKPWSFTFRFKVRRRLTEAVTLWGEPIGIVTEIVPRFAFNLRRCPRTPAPNGQEKCPERTGLLLGTERHWSHFGERQRLSRDPAPPAPLLVRGFGGGGASRFNPARDPNHVSQETLI
jgi:hypothetical protein